MHRALLAVLVSFGCASCGRPLTAPVVESPPCPVEGWCWSNPLPQGNSLSGVWASGPADAWAVGAAGTIVHWDGARWSASASGTTAYLFAVTGTSARDVWAFGVGGAIVHWDGARWSSVPSGTTVDLSDAWASGPDDVWATGFVDESMDTANGSAIADRRGVAFHWDGRSWALVSIGTDALLTGVWGTGPHDVWMVGTDATTNVVVHWDGARWAEVARLDDAGGFLSGIWGSGPRDVRVYGYMHQFHYDGQTWAPEDLGILGSIDRITGTGANDVWAVGSDLGSEYVDVLHFDGTSWTKATDRDARLSGVWATGRGEAWAVGSWGDIERWDGRAWSAADHDLVEDAPDLSAAWGSAADDVWAVGEGVALRWNGRAWARAASAPSNTVSGMWGSAADDIWAVGSPLNQIMIFHWDGSAWTTALSASALNNPSSLWGVWGSGPRDVWAVGHKKYDSQALLYHWDGAAWTLDSTKMGNLTSVWGSGPKDVWAGGFGALLHFDGSAWSTVMSDDARSFGPIWGSSASDVWLAGQSHATGTGGPELRHWDGSSWSLVDGAPAQTLISLWGRRVDDLWAIGAMGYDLTMFHYDGRAWMPSAPRTSGLDNVVGALWGSDSGEVWAVGGNAILHHAAP